MKMARARTTMNETFNTLEAYPTAILGFGTQHERSHPGFLFSNLLSTEFVFYKRDY